MPRLGPGAGDAPGVAREQPAAASADLVLARADVIVDQLQPASTDHAALFVRLRQSVGNHGTRDIRAMRLMGRRCVCCLAMYDLNFVDAARLSQHSS